MLVLGGIGFLIYTIGFSPVPTCNDGVQNQGEVGVDCGGPCGPCGVESAQAIRVNSVVAIPLAGGVSVVAEVLNPNVEFASPLFAYTLELYDSLGKSVRVLRGSSFLYTGEVSYVVYPRVDIDSSLVTGARMSIDSVDWVATDEFVKPSIQVLESESIKNSFFYVNGTIKNNDERPYNNVAVVALLYTNEGNLIGASQSIVDMIDPFANAQFSIPFPASLTLYQPGFDASGYFPRTMTLGDSGTDVSTLQLLLAETGIVSRDPSGFYDSQTQAGVVVLQQQLGLEPTGSFDEQTRASVLQLLTGAAEQTTEGQEETAVDATKTKVFIRAHR